MLRALCCGFSSGLPTILGQQTPGSVNQLGRISAAVLLLLASNLAVPVFAQGDGLLILESPETVCEIPTDHPDLSQIDTQVQYVRAQYDPNIASTASINVTYNGFSAPAQAAFQFAVDIWEQHIDSTVPIKVTANWTPLAPNVLGSAGANFVWRNLPNFPLADTWYPDALADALDGSDRSPGTPDINANFNSTFANWYFGTDGHPPGGQFDLVMVVLHELGHGLGFFGTMEVDNGTGTQECNGVNGNGCWDLGSPNEDPTVFDRFTEDGPGVALINTGTYPNPSTALGTALRSNDVHFDGGLVRTVLGMRGKLYAPGTWNGGSSYSHWNEASFPAGNENSLMTPFVSPGESNHSPGPATCAHFSVIGWTLGPACEALVVANEPQATIAEGVALGSAYPNPFTNEATLTLRVDRPQHVRAALYDLLGRRLAVLHDDVVGAGIPLNLSVRGASLPPSVYVVRIEGEDFVTTQRVVRAR